MRLKTRDIDAIKAAALDVFGATASVRLFGSRTRDDLRGGDIDLLIEADSNDEPGWCRVGAFKDVLFRHIDEQKIDVVLVERGRPRSAFAECILPDSVALS